MEFHKIHVAIISNRRWVGAILISISLLIFGHQLIARSARLIVVAKGPIESGQVISRSDLQTVKSTYTWPDAVTDFKRAVGKRAVMEFAAGQPLSNSGLTPRLIFDPQTPSAVKITLPNTNSSADLKVGSRVDVYAGSDAIPATKVISDALVISVRKSDWAGFGNSNSGVSLAVLPNQVRQVADFSDSAHYTFVTLAK